MSLSDRETALSKPEIEMDKVTYTFDERMTAIIELAEMAKTADRAMNREESNTEGYSWYKAQRDQMLKTLKRITERG